MTTCFVCSKPATVTVFGHPCCASHGLNLYRNLGAVAA